MSDTLKKNLVSRKAHAAVVTKKVNKFNEISQLFENFHSFSTFSSKPREKPHNHQAQSYQAAALKCDFCAENHKMFSCSEFLSLAV